MKNTIKTIGIIVLAAIIGFSFIACDNGGSSGGNKNTGGNTGGNAGGNTGGITPGVLTITGLDDYNDKWVIAFGGTSTEELFAAANISDNWSLTGGQISNGNAELKVYDVTNASKLNGYKGTGKSYFEIIVLDKNTLTADEIEELEGEPSWLVTVGFGEADFNAGTGTMMFLAEEFEPEEE